MAKFQKEVQLKNGKKVILRLLTKNDLENLIEFFQSLPEEDRMFLRSDVMQRENILRRYGNLNHDKIYPIIAFSNRKMIAIGTIFRAEFGWMRNLGELRCVVSRDYQKQGLCTILIKELFFYAVKTDLQKIQVELIEDQKPAISACERMGFKREAVLHKHVTDIHGYRRNLVIMSLDIEDLWQILEDFTIGKTYVV